MTYFASHLLLSNIAEDAQGLWPASLNQGTYLRKHSPVCAQGPLKEVHSRVISNSQKLTRTQMSITSLINSDVVIQYYVARKINELEVEVSK